MNRKRSAMTMIELLVVISIIAVLAAMLLGGAAVLRRSAMSNKSRAILTTVQQAFEQNRALKGGVMAPAEHPLAGSLATRFVFVRADGSPLSATGIALRNASPAQLGAAADRLLLPDDIYADNRAPMLYGMPRDRLGVPGAMLPEVTAYRRLDLQAGTISAADSAGYAVPDATQAAAGAAQVSTLLQYVLGTGSATAELSKLGALNSPPDDTQLILNRRVWSDDAPGTASRPRTRVLDGTAMKTYRLRGLGIYDAWDREILYSLTAGGGCRFESAGPDGFFRWNPGVDGVFQTPAHAASALAGSDDRDASIDNLSTITGTVP